MRLSEVPSIALREKTRKLEHLIDREYVLERMMLIPEAEKAAYEVCGMRPQGEREGDGIVGYEVEQGISHHNGHLM